MSPSLFIVTKLSWYFLLLLYCKSLTVFFWLTLQDSWAFLNHGAFGSVVKEALQACQVHGYNYVLYSYYTLYPLYSNHAQFNITFIACPTCGFFWTVLADLLWEAATEVSGPRDDSSTRSCCHQTRKICWSVQCSVDWEIFTVKIFLPITQVATTNCTEIKCAYELLFAI